MEHRCRRCGGVLTSIDASCEACGAAVGPRTDTLDLPESGRAGGTSSELPSGFSLSDSAGTTKASDPPPRELALTESSKPKPATPGSLDDDPLLLPIPGTTGGKVLGGVRLLRRLGSGGMGAVYAGQHLTLDMTVAVKILLAHHGKDSDYAERFVREAQVSARIDHHNLVRTLHAGQEHGVFFIQMEFVDGTSAADLLRRSGQLPESEAIRIVLDATRGLAEAHRRGIVHRDVKPDNILIRREDGRAKLADLGLALAFLAPSTPSLTGTGTALGTPLYMAPEQIESASAVGPPADIYSMGATLYELVCGKPPFSAPTIASLFREILTLPAPDPAILRPGISPGLREVIVRSLDKQPACRYQSAEELEEALERALAGASDTPAAPGTATKTAALPPATVAPATGASPSLTPSWQQTNVRSATDVVSPAPLEATKIEKPSPGEAGSARRTVKTVLATTGVIALVLLGARLGGKFLSRAATGTERALVVGFLPDRRITTERLKSLEPVQRMLERATGRKVEPFVGFTYAENVEAFAQGRIDVAQFGGVTYVLATRKLKGAVPIVQRDLDRRFHTLFLATPRSGIEKLEDLRGKSFAFVDPLSTSGYLVPALQLIEAGIEPRVDAKGFSHVVFTHGHDASLEELVAGRVDCAAVEERVHDQALYLGKLDRSQVKIIGTSKPFPDDAWVASPDLDPGVREAIARAFLSLSPMRQEDAQVLAALEAKRYVALKDQDYDDLREKVKLLDSKGLLKPE
ncbi:phosphate/phosphite/phosphonate ABC transporter substrate-binding protein [bacterium]|nr:phosphate/phosphite/phosphonate ABC transporter substrate-binding protein [bacterium]